MRSTKLLLSALAGIAIISCAEPTGPVASAAPKGDEAAASNRGSSPHILKNVDVTGTVQGGGTFAGKFTATRFDWDQANGQLLVTGILSGFAYATDGSKQHVRQEVTTTAVLSREATVASLGADAGLVRPVAQTCDVLFLDLGPLFLDVLGLTVDLSQIVLDINAVGGSGNLLGNLLCGLLSILDGFPILANILAILEQINTLLGNLNNLFPAAA